jgi:hypothetical protein
MYKKVHLHTVVTKKRILPFLKRFMRQRYMFLPDSNSFGIHTLTNQVSVYDVYGKLHGLQVEHNLKGEFISILLCAPSLSNVILTSDLKLKMGHLYFRTDTVNQPDLTFFTRRALKIELTKLKIIECETDTGTCILSYCTIS